MTSRALVDPNSIRLTKTTHLKEQCLEGQKTDKAKEMWFGYHNPTTEQEFQIDFKAMEEIRGKRTNIQKSVFSNIFRR